MQVTIFGASGRVGRQVVALALASNYPVVAFVHSHSPFEATTGLTVVQGDVADRLAVAAALKGSQAVISSLSSWGTKDKNTLRTAMRAIIPAMEAQGITRLITLTGAGATTSHDKLSLLDKLNHRFLKTVAPQILVDSERHLALLEESDLAWTSLRSPVMLAGKSKKYQLRMAAKPWATVDRSAVAQAMFDQLSDTSRVQLAPIITRR